MSGPTVFISYSHLDESLGLRALGRAAGSGGGVVGGGAQVRFVTLSPGEVPALPGTRCTMSLCNSLPVPS
jgi:hypothetical protein